jgi:hypothetical protein
LVISVLMQWCAPDDPAGFRRSRLPKILAEIQVVCNDSKLDLDRPFLGGRPETKRCQPPGQRPHLRFRKVCDEKDGLGKKSEDHNDFHISSC